MQMSIKQILSAAGSAVLAALIFIWLFASPISVNSVEYRINTLSQTAYENTIVPYFLDSSSSKYVNSVSHFIDDYDPSRSADEYTEIYVLFTLSKITPVPFRSVWVGIDDIPEEYKDYVICVTTGPMMTSSDKENYQGNVTVIVRHQDLTREQIEDLAQKLSYRIKWSLAMGIDGNIHI